MLATDLNNPEFVGARNPDDGLYKEFFWHEAVDSWASREESQKQQRRVTIKLPKAIYLRLMVPGDKTTEVVQLVTEAHKQRFPREWMRFQIEEGLIGGEGEIPGWKLSEWPELNEETVRELLYLRFQTVEQLAGASDKQIQGIGMGGLALREKARVAIRNKMGAETVRALEEKDAEMAELKERLVKMEAMLMGTQPPAAPAETAPESENVTDLAEKRKPGRPPKPEQAAI